MYFIYMYKKKGGGVIQWKGEICMSFKKNVGWPSLADVYIMKPHQYEYA